MKSFKGFDKDLKCRGFQYEVGKEYEEPTASLCSSGFHACENPLDVFSYYAPSDSRYCEVDLENMSDERQSSDSKICGKKIKINAEIGLNGLAEAAVKFIFEKVDWNNAKESNTGDQSAATVNGNDSIAVATGYQGKAKGALGCAICVAERDNDYKLISIKAAIIDGETLKANTYYMLQGGEFVEAE